MSVDSIDCFCAIVDLADDGSFVVRFPEPVMHMVTDADAEDYGGDPKATHEHWTVHDRILVCRDDAEVGRAMQRARKACLKIRELLAKAVLMPEQRE